MGGNKGGILSCEVRFSERHRERMVDDMIAVRQDRDNKYLKRLEAKESEVEATKEKVIHNDIKIACLGLLIKVGQKVPETLKILNHCVHLCLQRSGMDKILGRDVYQHFFTGASTRNQKSRGLLMLLIDYGISQKLEESSKLLKNLRQWCTIFASLPANQEKSEEELQGLIEVDWTTRLCEMFHNLRLARRTQDVSPRLTDLLARFNGAHGFKVIETKKINLFYTAIFSTSLEMKTY